MKMEAAMVKLSAYPITFVFFCFNFLANSAEFLKENDSIFKQNTPLAEIVQPKSVSCGSVGEKINLHHQTWLELVKNNPPRDHQEHTRAFEESSIPGVYRTPIKKGSNTYHILKGTTPNKKTPRRRNNIQRLKRGAAPVLVIDDKIVSYELHHVGQENDHSHIVMLPKRYHKKQHKYFHTNNGPSRINRAGFRKQKREVFRDLANKMTEQLNWYQELEEIRYKDN